MTSISSECLEASRYSTRFSNFHASFSLLHFKLNSNEQHSDDDELIVCSEIDHRSFMESFNKMIAEYRIMLKKFQMFLTALFVCNVLTWICTLWNLIWTFSDGTTCVMQRNMHWEYGHFVVEILFFLLMWMVPIWRLQVNQSMVSRYRDDFVTKIVIKKEKGRMSTASKCPNCEGRGINSMINQHEKLMIKEYLDVIVDNRSPFKIYGLTPTPSKIVWLFSVILGPLTYNTFRYARDMS